MLDNFSVVGGASGRKVNKHRKLNMNNRRSSLRKLIKEGSDLNKTIHEESFTPLLKKIVDISRQNENVGADGNNVLQLKAGITRIGNSSFLNILEAKEDLVFDEAELISALKAYVMEDDEVVWQKLQAPAFKSMSRMVILPFPVQITAETVPQTATQKAARVSRAKRPAEEIQKTVAEKLSRFDADDTQLLESVYKDVLKSYTEGGQEPMPYYKLICDPQSFTKSVNNAFQMSFLIQSNLVRIFKSENGTTLAEPVDLHTPFTSQKGGDQAIHAVITLDYDMWESTVNNYNVETSMIG